MQSYISRSSAGFLAREVLGNWEAHRCGSGFGSKQAELTPKKWLDCATRNDIFPVTLQIVIAA